LRDEGRHGQKDSAHDAHAFFIVIDRLAGELARRVFAVETHSASKLAG